ncbi:hypothetical protein C8F04DRAFT_1321117 [Mycena alexandri]|uniref:Uncharacterized protein n=1 Tax=Mycena alexandri TaxID=1745969 RepID=A0AAD6WNX6_9AGAR|nr:hypothetical protein C8F04DRAFT_1321117 [Mycena alexandri]
MPVYDRSLQLAIEADKEAKLQGLQEDEKRADLTKADMIAEHFPTVQNILEDTSRYLLKASVCTGSSPSRGSGRVGLTTSKPRNVAKFPSSSALGRRRLLERPYRLRPHHREQTYYNVFLLHHLGCQWHESSFPKWDVTPRRTHRKCISALRLSSDTTSTLPEYFHRDVAPPPEYEADADDDRTDADPEECPLGASSTKRNIGTRDCSHRRRPSSPPLAPLPQDTFLDSLLERSVHELELSNALLQSSMSTPTSSAILRCGRDEEQSEGEPLPPLRSTLIMLSGPAWTRRSWERDRTTSPQSRATWTSCSSRPPSARPSRPCARATRQATAPRSTTRAASRTLCPIPNAPVPLRLAQRVHHSYTSRTSHTSTTLYTSPGTASSSHTSTGTGLRIAPHAPDEERGHVRLPSTIGLRSGGSEWGVLGAGRSRIRVLGSPLDVCTHTYTNPNPNPPLHSNSNSHSHAYASNSMPRPIAGLPSTHGQTANEIPEESGASASSVGSDSAYAHGGAPTQPPPQPQAAAESPRTQRAHPASRGRSAAQRRTSQRQRGHRRLGVGPARIGSAMGREDDRHAVQRRRTRVARPLPVPLAIIAVDSDFEESAYDTALEDLVPLTSRLRIDTTPTPPRIACENSDDTLVDIEPESRTRRPLQPRPLMYR